MKRKNQIHKKRFDAVDVVVVILLTLWMLLVIVPFVNAISISFATQKEYVDNPLMLFPSQPTLQSYKLLLNDYRIWVGFRTSFLLVVVGVPVSMLLTTMLAYGTSRGNYPGKKIIIGGILFTMLFNGGIIPLYLQMKEMGLTNTIWSVILAGTVNVFYFVIMRNYFQSLPESLMESARLDGAGEWRILFNIILPLSKPIIATLTLFYLVDRWNEWYNALIFIRNTDLQPLQLVLRSIVMESSIVNMEDGYRYLRCQMGTYGGQMGKGKQRVISPENSKPGAYYDPNQYCAGVVKLFSHLRDKLGYEVELLHDIHERLTPAQAIGLAKKLEPYQLFFLEDALSPEQMGWFSHFRNQTAVPLAMGELFNNPIEWNELISKRLIDYIRVHVSQIGGLTPARKLAALCENFGVRTAWHGPGDLSPVGVVAQLHLDLAIPNFGIQEFSGFSPEEEEVFPGCPQVRNGYLYANDKPGFGIDIDEKKAAMYPCSYREPGWLLARTTDGTAVRP